MSSSSDAEEDAVGQQGLPQTFSASVPTVAVAHTQSPSGSPKPPPRAPPRTLSRAATVDRLQLPVGGAPAADEQEADEERQGRSHSVWKRPQLSARRGDSFLGAAKAAGPQRSECLSPKESVTKRRTDAPPTPPRRSKERESMPVLPVTKRQSGEERVRGQSEAQSTTKPQESTPEAGMAGGDDPADVGMAVKSPRAKIALEKLGSIKVPGKSPRPHSGRTREKDVPVSPGRDNKSSFSLANLRKKTKSRIGAGSGKQTPERDPSTSNVHEEKRKSVQGSATFMASVKQQLNRQPIYMDMPPVAGTDPEKDMWGVSDEGTVLMQGSEHHYEVRAATLGKLVERLTVIYPDEHLPAQHYQKVFFMTFRSFATPMELMEKLEQRFLGPENVTEEQMANWKTDLPTIRKQVIVALKMWFNEHYKDFSANGGELTKRLQDFIVKAREADHSSDSLVGFLERMVEKKLSKGTYTSLFGCSIMIDKATAPETNAPRSFRGVTFWDLDELEIARQLTIGEYHIYAEIEPVELQDLAWSKSHLKERAPNVLAMINRFNKFSNAFSTMLVSEPKLKQRKKIIEKLVRIAEHLMSMNSFNMVMAIMSGFGSSSAYRLKHSFQAVNRHTQEVLAHLNEVLSSNSAYKAYRELLRSIDPPCIPFLGVYLSDLTFVDEGNKEKIDGLWNFRKRVLEYEVIVQVLKYQSHNYNLHMVPAMGKLLDELPIMGEAELHKLSL
eukprot:CAMPEP_0114636722 /NCGR_PEP_ID=MMETSP0168-20121206/17130_1 /TAXON_ID=95228 ORGANISM="Vannella sp., Strain DIVA3 517/6/12" /NCGR_SAMPLE_ID=MMETSP0168 /ASSEMBLY_ACC=CAM_ASM_000044 /LENGTH=725 /DNA_ID=CAMNT_0001848439 /DNA_START=101 /DNA_END=2274 /DNA_ORIENTATION=-